MRYGRRADRTSKDERTMNADESAPQQVMSKSVRGAGRLQRCIGPHERRELVTLFYREHPGDAIQHQRSESTTGCICVRGFLGGRFDLDLRRVGVEKPIERGSGRFGLGGSCHSLRQHVGIDVVDRPNLRWREPQGRHELWRVPPPRRVDRRRRARHETECGHASTSGPAKSQKHRAPRHIVAASTYRLPPLDENPAIYGPLFRQASRRPDVDSSLTLERFERVAL
jgi:hypothetical protein